MEVISMQKDSRLDTIREYNKTFMLLVNRLKRSDRFDVNIDSMHKKITTVKSIDEESIIKITGPHIYDYRDIIIANDIKIFLTELPEELQYAIDNNTNVPIVHIVDKIRELYSKSSEDVRLQIDNEIRSLLSIYIDYLVAE